MYIYYISECQVLRELCDYFQNPFMFWISPKWPIHSINFDNKLLLTVTVSASFNILNKNKTKQKQIAAHLLAKLLTFNLESDLKCKVLCTCFYSADISSFVLHCHIFYCQESFFHNMPWTKQRSIFFFPHYFILRTISVIALESCIHSSEHILRSWFDSEGFAWFL